MLEYFPELMKGLHTSLTLTVASIIVALILALIFTIILTLKTPVLVWIVRGYITLFTGTPLLVQIFLIYYGPGQFPSLQEYPVIWHLLSEPWLCALLALSLGFLGFQGLLSLLIVQLQLLLGYSSKLAGMVFLPMLLLSKPASIVAHQLSSRMDARWLASASLFALLLALLRQPMASLYVQDAAVQQLAASLLLIVAGGALVAVALFRVPCPPRAQFCTYTVDDTPAEAVHNNAVIV